MSQLTRYEAARSALAECQRIDEVKDIRDKAEAMAAYARQAKDTELIQFATEIKVRAERKCGEMLRASAERGERATAHGNVNPATVKVSDDTTPSTPTLAAIGITRDQSSRYQQLAAMPDEHFETAVATAKNSAGEVTTAFMLREAKRAKPKGRPQTGAKAEALRQDIRAAQQRGASMLASYARLLLTAVNAQQDFNEEERQVLSDLQTAIGRLPI